MTAHRILIVDDEPLTLSAWSTMLQLAGYVATTAETPEQALAACDEHAYDLAILDFIMPTMNGIELLSRIRKKRPLIRSIIISGQIDKDVGEATLTAQLYSAVEADVYLHKPVANSRLLDAIKNLLEKPSTGQSWVSIAKDTVAANSATIKSAKVASKKLRQHVKKKK